MAGRARQPDGDQLHYEQREGGIQCVQGAIDVPAEHSGGCEGCSWWFSMKIRARRTSETVANTHSKNSSFEMEMSRGSLQNARSKACSEPTSREFQEFRRIRGYVSTCFVTTTRKPDSKYWDDTEIKLSFRFRLHVEGHAREPTRFPFR